MIRPPPGSPRPCPLFPYPTLCRASVDLSSLRVIASGSAPLAPAMVRDFQEKLGIIIVNVFGSNEGMSFITGEGDMPDPDKRANLFPRRDRKSTRLNSSH